MKSTQFGWFFLEALYAWVYLLTQFNDVWLNSLIFCWFFYCCFLIDGLCVTRSLILSKCSKLTAWWCCVRCFVLVSHTLSTTCQICAFFSRLPLNCCCNWLLLCVNIALCVVHRHWHLVSSFFTFSRLFFFVCCSLIGYSIFDLSFYSFYSDIFFGICIKHER